MSPEEQRISIATACGWRELEGVTGYHPTNPRGKENIPDYLNDLNAMHEAEKFLNKGQTIIYMATLACGTGSFMATASQRAEAFLKTIGKWKE